MQDRSAPGITRLYPCDVECVSSARYGDRPTAIVLDQERLPISQIIKHWRSPEGIYFQVQTTNDLAFELIYDETSDEWRYRAI
jgi:hypothetical protein